MSTNDPLKPPNDLPPGDRRLVNIRVLVVSLIAIVLIFGLLYLVFSLNTPPSAD